MDRYATLPWNFACSNPMHLQVDEAVGREAVLVLLTSGAFKSPSELSPGTCGCLPGGGLPFYHFVQSGLLKA